MPWVGHLPIKCINERQFRGVLPEINWAIMIPLITGADLHVALGLGGTKKSMSLAYPKNFRAKFPNDLFRPIFPAKIPDDLF